MDDILSGANTVEEAKKIISELNSMLSEGGFQLSKFASNYKPLLNFTTNNKSSNTTDIITVLGLIWNPSNDNLYCTRPPVDFTHAYQTKREVLSFIAKLYDPLGLIGPVVILVKMLIQELWKLKIDWNSPLPPDTQATWNKFVDELPNLNKLQIPRQVTLANCDFETLTFKDFQMLQNEPMGRWHTLNVQITMVITKQEY